MRCRHSLGLGGFGGDAGGGSAVGQEYTLRGRRLRVVRQLGEGGYSFVYLVRQLADAGPSTATSSLLASPALGTQLFALKRVSEAVCAALKVQPGCRAWQGPAACRALWPALLLLAGPAQCVDLWHSAEFATARPHPPCPRLNPISSG